MMLHARQNSVQVTGGESEALADGLRVFHIRAGTSIAARVTLASKSAVSFVVLTPEQGRQFWRLPFAGRDRAVLSPATVIDDGAALRVQADSGADLRLGMFPPVAVMKSGGAKLAGRADGIFTQFAAPAALRRAPVTITAIVERAAGPNAAGLHGMSESAWDEAAVYSLNIPSGAAGRHLLLNIHYVGDAARLYVGSTLFDDNFYNGDAFAVALWRIPVRQWGSIRLKILPYSDALMGRLPESAKVQVSAAKAASALDKIAVTTAEQNEWWLAPR